MELLDAREPPVLVAVSKATLLADLGIDSLEFLEVLSIIEARLGLTVDDTLLVGVGTVGDVMAVLDTLVQATGGTPSDAH